MPYRFVRTSVSLQHIEAYLSEPEVPDYVSSLKRPALDLREPVDSRLGCAGAVFRWPTSPKPKPGPQKP